jgi:hypothetical protein
MVKKMEISRATIGDGEEILKLQKIAYQSEAERYGNYDISMKEQCYAQSVGYA